MLKITVAEDNDSERSRRWADWIRRIGEGDIDSLSALYDESAPVLFGLAIRILEDRPSAEEALLDTYNHVREQAGKFDPRDQTALDWLIALVRRFAAARVDRSSPSFRLDFGENDPLRDKRQLADLALAELPEEQRCVLEMIYLGGLTLVEVADLLRRPREYVARQIVFGMRTLRRFSQNPARSAGESLEDLLSVRARKAGRI